MNPEPHAWGGNNLGSQVWNALNGIPNQPVKSKGHPGFKAVANKIAKTQGVSKKAAGAILAASTRKASPAAKKANPNLKRVK